MKLEQQVCSLELAKKLKELGVKQESLFYWLEYKSFPVKPWQLETKESLKHVNYPERAIPAFTVAELGEMLKKMDYSFPEFDGIAWVSIIRLEDSSYRSFSADTEADARAKMLVYLLESELITL